MNRFQSSLRASGQSHREFVETVMGASIALMDFAGPQIYSIDDLQREFHEEMSAVVWRSTPAFHDKFHGITV